jgi:hypothetical protein
LYLDALHAAAAAHHLHRHEGLGRGARRLQHLRQRLGQLLQDGVGDGIVGLGVQHGVEVCVLVEVLHVDLGLLHAVGREQLLGLLHRRQQLEPGLGLAAHVFARLGLELLGEVKRQGLRHRVAADVSCVASGLHRQAARDVGHHGHGGGGGAHVEEEHVLRLVAGPAVSA